MQTTPPDNQSKPKSTKRSENKSEASQSVRPKRRKPKSTLADVQLRLVLYRFYAQIGFSLIVVSLCVWQLTTKAEFDAAERAIYWSSLSGTVANWLPSPLEKVEKSVECAAKKADEDEDEDDG